MPRLQAALIRAAARLLRALGPVRASDLGGAVARTIGPLLPVSRVADLNLRMALPELDAAARRRTVRAMWDNLGRTAAELPHVPALVQCDSGPGWSVEGRAHVDAVLAAGGPAIILTGHIGNWELLPKAGADLGLLAATIYRPSGNPAVDEAILELRRAGLGAGALHFPKGAQGARQTLQHLRQGGAVGMLTDQKMNDGIEARLFGRPAMTAPALAVLALRFRCPVLPSFVLREGPARFRVVIEPPLPLPDSGDRAADVAQLTQAANDALERRIRAWPAGWLWLHRRWDKRLYAR
jgi:Kdo2-lipid IVA lauroyltransferase/acyltransferase